MVPPYVLITPARNEAALIEGTLRSIPEKHRKNPERLAESVRRSVRAAVNEAWGKKPICKVLVNVVDRG